MINCIKNNRGWSLPELLVVVGILGITAAISFPALIKSLPKWNANSVAKDISGKLMLARLRAVKNNQTYCVEFTASANRDSFEVKKWDGADWDSEGFLSYGTSDVDVIPGAECDDAGTDRAQFNPNGTAMDGTPPDCVIVVQTKDNTWVRQLAIDENTGRISITYCEQGGC